MERVSIPMLMDQSTKEIGLKISNMELELKSGLMVLVMKENINSGRSMEEVPLPGLIGALSLVNFKITILMEMVFMSGQMEEFIRVIGRTIKWKDMVLSHGQMEDYTSVSILMI